MARSLVSTIAIHVPAFHQERLALIDAEDYSGVDWKVREELSKQGHEVSDPYIKEGLLALKQYYAVALLDSRNEHAVSDEIDPFWHAHILHTRLYHAFGERVFGQYIHHEPLKHARHGDVDHVAALYAYTARIYTEIFNYTNPLFYPAVQPRGRLCCVHCPVPAIADQGLFTLNPVA